METRTISEKKIYKLILNPVTWRCEDWTIVAISYSAQWLLDWKASLLVEMYTDDDWVNMVWSKLNKVFQKGSELEFFNNKWPWFNEGIFDWTIFDEWINYDMDVKNYQYIMFID